MASMSSDLTLIFKALYVNRASPGPTTLRSAWMSGARIATVALLASISLHASQANTWTDAGTKNGVALTFRDNPQLDAREVRAVAELPHASGRIIPIVCDFTQMLDPDVREARVLSGEINSRYEVYLHYAPQYLVVSARDVVIDVRRADDGCTWSEVADRVTSPAGTVRMPLLRGAWTVEAIGASRSRVTYQIVVKPGGSIPDWMVRRGAAGALPDVIARVSRCLSNPALREGRCPKL
jgi:hypothetical protein